MSFAGLLLLALKGALVAAVPLAYVRYSRDADKFRKLAWVTAFLTLDLIMFGSFTRLTDSGLGCPDWPGCYGHSNPLSANEPIRAAETALPSGPVTVTKAWIEMVHRYFAMGVGLLIIILAVQAWVRWRGEGGRSPWLATAALAWVIGQGAFGALTVTMKLQPAIVTIHLLGGMGLLALLTWLALREGDGLPVQAPAGGRRLAVAALVVVLLQIALGGWVSTNYAVMACPDFPLCQGQLVPPMDFTHAFTLWRPLGRTSSGEVISFQSLVAIHWTHRLVAVIVILVLGMLVWRLRKASGLQVPARALLGLLLLQVATGMSNVVLQWPLVLAVAHSGGAALMVAVLVVIMYRLTRGGR
ncbi:MAG: COX15/CtaA family protein [Burkholderiaceae bacterium]